VRSGAVSGLRVGLRAGGASASSGICAFAADEPERRCGKGFGKNLFADWRYDANGAPKPDFRCPC
jgi:hypothetical protein